MAEWIRAFRLPVCIFAAGLSFVSFRLGGVRPCWSVVIATLLIVSSTMLQNDWRDRSHDFRKGKTTASKHQRLFFCLVVVMWGISAVVALIAASQSWMVGLVLFGAILVGLVYSETRIISMVPVTLVVIASASPALVPILVGAESKKLWLVFFSSAFMIFGREIIKDLDDFRIDRGYKWTIPFAIGERRAKIMAFVAVVVGSALVVGVTAATLPGVSLAMVGAFLLLYHNERRNSKHFIDLGMAIAIAALGVWG